MNIKVFVFAPRASSLQQVHVASVCDAPTPGKKERMQASKQASE